jgi:hypothetical protein
MYVGPSAVQGGIGLLPRTWSEGPTHCLRIARLAVSPPYPGAALANGQRTGNHGLSPIIATWCYLYQSENRWSCHTCIC